jgi:hypothetical protein
MIYEICISGEWNLRDLVHHSTPAYRYTTQSLVPRDRILFIYTKFLILIINF